MQPTFERSFFFFHLYHSLPLHKPCENLFLFFFYQNICFVQIFFLSLHLTQLVRKGERVKTYW